MANTRHVLLTSHPASLFKHAAPLNWGEADPLLRGPVVASLTTRERRNSIGTHSGSYAVYRALANASGALTTEHKPDFTNTAPVVNLGPFEAWGEREKIVSLDPWGAKVNEVFQNFYQAGYDIRPSIAITTAHISVPEITQAINEKRLLIDGKIITKNKDVFVTKAAIDPVWYLPGIAKRFGILEGELRCTLFDQTGGMFPELITRRDLKVLLPPIGSTSVYLFGDVQNVSCPKKILTLRIHDECNGSDVFGSDICTCRPYLTHGIEEGIRTAQEGGSGVVVYFRKEGRALGEVTKFLVYNARKRQEGGDHAATYFQRTTCVAGVQDMRFQQLMPDVLHWLGIKKIDNLVSMSDMKYNAIIQSGIEVQRRISLPKELIPPDAHVEMEAKKSAGYFTEGETKSIAELKKVKGRQLNE
jgi:GTP cyclohydrolase II